MAFMNLWSFSNTDTKKTNTKTTDTEKYPGLTKEQIKWLDDKTSSLKGSEKEEVKQELYEYMIQDIQNKKHQSERIAAENTVTYNSTNEKDPNKQNYGYSNVRLEKLADKVKNKYGLNQKSDTKDIMDSVMQEANMKNVDLSLMNGYLENGDKEFLYQMGYSKRPEEIAKDIATNPFVLGGVGTVGVGGGLYGISKYGGEALETAGKNIYQFNIDSSKKEATQIQNVEANKKVAEMNLKEEQSKLKELKKNGTQKQITAQQKKVNQAQEALVQAQSKEVRTVADTAMDYNIGGGKLTEGLTDESRGVQAKTAATQLWQKEINPMLEKSKSTINVQDIINELGNPKDGGKSWIEKMAKNDPAKQQEYFEAWEAIKEEFAGEKYKNYSMVDSQELKSGLQSRTPKKFYNKQGMEREITDAYKEIKATLGEMIKDELHSKLTKEFGVDTASKYKDWANLTKYADDMASSATNGGFKGGYGGFLTNAYHAATDGATQKLGLAVNKTGKGLKKGSEVVDTVIDTVKGGVSKTADVVKDSVKSAVKRTEKGLDTVLDTKVGKVLSTGWKNTKGFRKTSGKILGNTLKIFGEIADYKAIADTLNDKTRKKEMLETAVEAYKYLGEPENEEKFLESLKPFGITKDDLYDAIADSKGIDRLKLD